MTRASCGWLKHIERDMFCVVFDVGDNVDLTVAEIPPADLKLPILQEYLVFRTAVIRLIFRAPAAEKFCRDVQIDDLGHGKVLSQTLEGAIPCGSEVKPRRSSPRRTSGAFMKSFHNSPER